MADEPLSPTFKPRAPLTQQSSLGDLGPNVAPPPAKEKPKINKWQRWARK